MCVPDCSEVYHICAGTPEVQKKAPDPMVLELQAFESRHVGSGTEPRSSGRAASALSSQHSSPVGHFSMETFVVGSPSCLSLEIHKRGSEKQVDVEV